MQKENIEMAKKNEAVLESLKAFLYVVKMLGDKAKLATNKPTIDEDSLNLKFFKFVVTLVV